MQERISNINRSGRCCRCGQSRNNWIDDDIYLYKESYSLPAYGFACKECVIRTKLLALVSLIIFLLVFALGLYGLWKATAYLDEPDYNLLFIPGAVWLGILALIGKPGFKIFNTGSKLVISQLRSKDKDRFTPLGHIRRTAISVLFNNRIPSLGIVLLLLFVASRCSGHFGVASIIIAFLEKGISKRRRR